MLQNLPLQPERFRFKPKSEDEYDLGTNIGIFEAKGLIKPKFTYNSGLHVLDLGDTDDMASVES